MKPNFALSLSFEGIHLLRRAYLGWHHLGEVSLDTPDLASALSDLRAKALKFAPGGITTKLIIPDDQIKYLDLPTDERWTSDRTGFVRAALEDATPYDVSDLAYDWSVSGDRVQIAAVARDTLSEAESFAADHEFAPLSFVAQPSDGKFNGEPFFGETSVAARHLPAGESVERDMTRLHVIPVPEPAPDPAEETPPAPEVETSEPSTEAPADELPLPASGDAPSPPPEASDADDAEPVAAAVDADETRPLQDDKTSPATNEEPSPEASFSEIQSDLLDSFQPESAEDEEATDHDAESPPTADTKPDDQDAAASTTGFTSIRARRGAEEDTPLAPRLEGVSRLTSIAGVPAAPNADTDTEDRSPKDDTTADNRATPPLSAPMVAPLAADEEGKTPPSITASPANAAIAAPGAGAGAFFSVRRPGAKPTKPAAAKTAKAAAPATRRTGRRVSQTDDEKQRMTIFGAREQDVGGKPRFLGLILTAVLLLFLVLVAVWASIFLDDGLAGILGQDSETETAETTPIPDPDDPVAVATGNQPTTDRVVEAEIPEDAATPEPSTLSETPSTARPLALSPDEARTRYAATGIWQMSPTPPDAPGSERLSSFDTGGGGTDQPVARPDPSTLPQLAALQDMTPPTPLTPDSPDIQLDVEPETQAQEAPLVEATPDGALTPDGIRVFAGRPEVEPPRDMARTAPPEDEIAPETSEEAVAEAGVVDPALATPRPRVRPESVTQEAEAETDAETETADLTDSDAIAAAVASASTANLDAEAETETDTPEPGTFENPTEQAIEVSLTPSLRPAGFASTVEAAREAQASRAVSAEQSMSAALPSSASVSRSATEQNAINLRQVNLIGVYGGPSSRRALVRLSNGRYKKVKVGDRLDGGRVAAIGDSELRYVKRGQNVVLKMPRG